MLSHRGNLKLQQFRTSLNNFLSSSTNIPEDDKEIVANLTFLINLIEKEPKTFEEFIKLVKKQGLS